MIQNSANIFSDTATSSNQVEDYADETLAEPTIYHIDEPEDQANETFQEGNVPESVPEEGEENNNIEEESEEHEAVKENDVTTEQSPNVDTSVHSNVQPDQHTKEASRSPQQHDQTSKNEENETRNGNDEEETKPAVVSTNDSQSEDGAGQEDVTVMDICVREGCPNRAIVDDEWEDEYCSNECCVKHCEAVFKAWVAENRMALAAKNPPAAAPTVTST